jgi:hypothetical protein
MKKEEHKGKVAVRRQREMERLGCYAKCTICTRRS